MFTWTAVSIDYENNKTQLVPMHLQRSQMYKAGPSFLSTELAIHHESQMTFTLSIMSLGQHWSYFYFNMVNLGPGRVLLVWVRVVPVKTFFSCMQAQPWACLVRSMGFAFTHN